MNTRNRILSVVLFLYVATLSCSSSPDKLQEGSAQENDIENQVVIAEEDRTEVETKEQRTISPWPNLELTAITSTTHDLGDGMQRAVIYLAGKNASSGWWSYGLTAYSWVFGQTPCYWNMGATTSDPQGIGKPVLETDSGYTYQAITNLDWNCGPRQVWDVPPGMEFTGIGKSYESSTPFGFIFFDIPITATPKSITLYYNDGGLIRLSEGYEPIMITIPVIHPTEWQPSPYKGPFDPDYSEYLHIYRVGEIIEVGNLAEVVVQSPGTQVDGSLPITITITSLHEGYPLVIDDWDTNTSLVFEYGTLCCHSGLSTWGVGSDNIIGPLQSTYLQAEFGNPENLRTWLIVGITLKEVSSTKIEFSAQFVVELP